MCLVVGSGLDLDAGNEEVLVGRLAVMYLMVLGISFITRFERVRWQTSVSRERQLLRERIELSQTIHDTTAQTAYMIGLGIHRARELAGESNEDLVAALDATSALTRSAMWEVRGPIDAGHILEGRELGRVLWSHCATFERITGVHAEMSQSGTEPSLATETRARLFSIAHNALTNAFLHARPGRVEVRLTFGAGQIRLSVSDDGVGLPDGYAERGRGFNGMRSDAEQMGGALIVESGEGVGGTTISCVVPYVADQRGEGLVRQWGIPLALYSDRHAAFKYNARQAPVLAESTQFARVMRELGIRQIYALSPQAKGRVERMGSTLQDRLVTELRLAGAATIQEANDVLQQFLPRFNAQFAVAAGQPEKAYRINRQGLWAIRRQGQ